MASRGIALGRIIDWAKGADAEELAFAIVRMSEIAKERSGRVDRADASGKVKRTRRATMRNAKTGEVIVHTDEAEQPDAPERGISA